jgi:hypothetical protein
MTASPGSDDPVVAIPGLRRRLTCAPGAQRERSGRRRKLSNLAKSVTVE